MSTVTGYLNMYRINRFWIRKEMVLKYTKYLYLSNTSIRKWKYMNTVKIPTQESWKIFIFISFIFFYDFNITCIFNFKIFKIIIIVINNPTSLVYRNLQKEPYLTAPLKSKINWGNKIQIKGFLAFNKL